MHLPKLWNTLNKKRKEKERKTGTEGLLIVWMTVPMAPLPSIDITSLFILLLLSEEPQSIYSSCAEEIAGIHLFDTLWELWKPIRMGLKFQKFIVQNGLWHPDFFLMALKTCIYAAVVPALIGLVPVFSPLVPVAGTCCFPHYKSIPPMNPEALKGKLAVINHTQRLNNKIGHIIITLYNNGILKLNKMQHLSLNLSTSQLQLGRGEQLSIAV